MSASPLGIEEAKRLSAAAYLIKAHLLPRGLSETVGEVLPTRSRLVAPGSGNGIAAKQAS